MFKVVIVQPIAEEGVKKLEEQGYEVKLLEDRSIENLKKEVEDADAILVRDARIPREVIECGKKLKVISRHGVGIESIDVKAATEKGIYVTNTPTANDVSVAEHVIGLITALAKNLVIVDNAIRNGGFEIRHKCYGIQLEGKTLGILGLGKIGRKVASRAAHGLEMKVVGYDPYVKQEELGELAEVKSSIEEVLRESDFVSLNLPLTENTRELIGINEFKMMKHTAYFINCSRGQVVKEKELIEALDKGIIAGCGLDVYEIDPPLSDNPLFAMKNTVLTPHTAAHTNEAMVNMAVYAAQGIIEVLSGKQPAWPVNRL